MTTLEERDAATQPTTTHPASSQAKIVETAANKPLSTVSQPSTWRRLRMSAARHPRLIQFGILGAIATGTTVFLLYSLFKGAWSANQNNYAILQTIFKMELGRKSALPVGDNPQTVITHTFTSLERKDSGFFKRINGAITLASSNEFIQCPALPIESTAIASDARGSD